MFYIGSYRQNVKIFLPRAFIFGMKHQLVVSTKFVRIISLGPKMVPPRGSIVLHRPIKGKYEKSFLSETTRPRDLTFGM